MKLYLIRVGDATSQWFNTAFFGGHPNESISGRAYRERRPWLSLIDWLLRPLGKDHCKSAYDNDISYAASILAKHRKDT